MARYPVLWDDALGQEVASSSTITLNGSTFNLIDMPAAGQSTPANGATPPVGQKICLYRMRSATDGDYAIGAASGEMWFSMGANSARTIGLYIGNVRRLQVSQNTTTVTNQLVASTASKLGAFGTAMTGSGTLVGGSVKYQELATAGITATLPSASTFSGYDYYLINTSSGAATVAGASATETIGNTSNATQNFSLASGATVHVASNGTLWRVL